MRRAEGKAARLLQIEALLLANPDGMSQAEIARRLGVNRSTIHRYLPELDQFCVHETEEGRLAIDRDRYPVRVRLSLHEAMALHLGARLMATRMDKHNPHAAAALRKLGLAVEPLAPLISRHLMRSADVMDAPERRRDPTYLAVLETLTRAWSDGRKVKLWYRKSSAELAKAFVFAPYFIEPYGIGRTAYVIGWRDDPPGERTLKVERIRRIEMIAEPYDIPHDFDPYANLGNAWGIWYSERESQKVVLQFHPRVVGRVQETQWLCGEQTALQDDGFLVWEAEVAEPREMKPWIRGWGPDCEVLKPKWLRLEVAEEMQDAAHVYLEQAGDD
jgi:CRISPR-associated endonuclease/helicase Cas3